MDLRFRQPWLPVLGCVASLVLAGGCGDDSVCPCETGPWADVALPDLGEARLVGVAARGTRVVGIGVSLTSAKSAIVQSTGGSWETIGVPTAPSDVIYLGVALDASARLILVGGSPSLVPIVADERAQWTIPDLMREGALYAVATGGDDSVLAVGTAVGGLAAASSAPGVWSADHAGFTTPQEKGLVDLAYANGVYAACGWDDSVGRPILRLHDGNGWKDTPGPAVVFPPEYSVEYRAVCIEPGGALWLGGALIDATGGGPRYSAWLMRRTSSMDWIGVVLPDAGPAESINDILSATDGSVYLACGRTTARVLRWDGMRWSDEGPGVLGGMSALAEDATGRIYAAGFRGDRGTDQPLLRVRTP